MRVAAMPRALLAIFLSLFATAAFANRTICTEDPAAPSAKADKPVVAATPVVATVPANRAAVAATTPANATASASTNTNAGAAHLSRPRVISPRWQSLLPGMIR